MYKFSLLKIEGKLMKDVIELLKNARVTDIVTSHTSAKKTMWTFNSKCNRFIATHASIDISTNQFCWPLLCVIKENNLAKSATPASKMKLKEKLKLWNILRKFKKKLTDSNKLENQKYDDFEHTLGYSGYVENTNEYDFIEYEHHNG